VQADVQGWVHLATGPPPKWRICSPDGTDRAMPSESELVRASTAGAASPGAKNEVMTEAWEARLAPAEAREGALYRRLAALGIAWVTHPHEPVFTVEEARA
jgi:hypothetical protein